MTFKVFLCWFALLPYSGNRSGAAFALWRIQETALFICLLQISFNSNLLFPGKFISIRPMKMVNKPCPGIKSIANPAIRKTAPVQFLIISKKILNTG